MCLISVYLVCNLAIYAKKTGVKTVGTHFNKDFFSINLSLHFSVLFNLNMIKIKCWILSSKYIALIIKNTGLQFLSTSVPRFNYSTGRIRQLRRFLVGDNKGFI